MLERDFFFDIKHQSLIWLIFIIIIIMAMDDSVEKVISVGGDDATG